MSVNKAILIGNLGADPELRYLPGGQAVCEFRMATTEKWTGRDGKQQEDTQWHRIVVWGKQGEQCKEYLAKGRQVYVEGRLRTREWQDAQGTRRFTTEVVGQRVQFLGGPRGESRGSASDGGSRPAPPEDAAPPAGGGGDDEIPF